MRFLSFFGLILISIGVAWAGDAPDGQALCKNVLKHEKTDMIMGAYYTKDGKQRFNISENAEFVYRGAFDKPIAVEGRCPGFLDQLDYPYLPFGSSLDTFQVYRHPLQAGKYLVFSNNIFGYGGQTDFSRRVDTLDTQTCRMERSKIHSSTAGKPKISSYAVYNNQLYAIFWGQEISWKIKNGSLIKKFPWPEIYNLTTDQQLVSGCEIPLNTDSFIDRLKSSVFEKENNSSLSNI